MGRVSSAWAGAWASSQSRVSWPLSEDRFVWPGPNRRRSGRRVAVVPRHPSLGARLHFAGVPLQLGQVVERVCLVQLARVDQTHKQVANTSPIAGLVEQGVLAVQDRLLQGPPA